MKRIFNIRLTRLPYKLCADYSIRIFLLLLYIYHIVGTFAGGEHTGYEQYLIR